MVNYSDLKFFKRKLNNCLNDVSEYRKNMYFSCIDDPEKTAKKIKMNNKNKAQKDFCKLVNKLVNKLFLNFINRHNELNYQNNFVVRNDYCINIL